MFSIVWFRNDLRVRDNESLFKALALGKPIIAVYCFDYLYFKQDTFGFKKTEKFRAKFLLESVNALKIALVKFNIPLITSIGNTEKIFSDLKSTIKIEAVFYQSEWTKEELDIENRVKKSLTDVNFKTSFSQFMYSPNDVYQVFNMITNSFTSFRKKGESFSKCRKIFTKIRC